MCDDLVSLIETCFGEHDLEFPRCGRSYAYSVLGPSLKAKRIVYGTKQSVIFAANELGETSEHLGLIARYGLPEEADASWIRDLAAGREIMFLGDLDPPDLLVFTWLRAKLKPLSVIYLGISDWYIDALQVRVPESYQIVMGPTESAAVATLKTALPDAESVIGPNCFDLLARGRKLELEAIVSAMGNESAILKPAIVPE